MLIMGLDYYYLIMQKTVGSMKVETLLGIQCLDSVVHEVSNPYAFVSNNRAERPFMVRTCSSEETSGHAIEL